MTESFDRPDAAAERSRRAYAALTRLAERHASTPQRRRRHQHPAAPAPDEIVRLVVGLAGGTVPVEPGEPEPDATDLMAALTLVPDVRADLDNVEFALLQAARARDMTWQDIAFGLGLATPQAAKQRHDRLRTRTSDEPAAR